jgi:hypothetical protein
VAIAPPVQPLDLGVLHASLVEWSDLASERRRLVACTWQEGVPLLAELAWPATELSAVVMARWPLGPTEQWCDFTVPASDSLACQLTAEQPLDYARRRGLSHLVVPRALVYGDVVDDADTLLQLAVDVAVVDVLERSVVWLGRVTSRPEDLRRFRDLDPDITAFERATYAWLVDLARVFARTETWPAREEGLRSVALRCHDPSPVFPPLPDVAAAPAAASDDARPAHDAPASEPASDAADATSDPRTPAQVP